MEKQELDEYCAFIKSKNLSGACNYCNKASDLFPYESNIILKNDDMPLIAVTCSNCGKVSFFRIGRQNTNR